MKTQNEIIKFTKNKWQKWSIAFKIMPIIFLVAILKLIAHYYGFEVLELNALFTSLVAGTIFLLGFLISGVLSDYKESEKIPSDISASIKSIIDDTYTLYKIKNSEAAKNFMSFQKTFIVSLIDWFYKKEKTHTILKKISEMNEFLIELDKEGVQAGYIVKIKNEQANLRKMILRIDTIRDTDFIGSAYAIVEAMAFLIGLGLIIIKIEPFYASVFFSLLVTFLITYMLFLIKDIDNPFDYRMKGESGTEISLKPLRDLDNEINNSN